MMQLTPEQQRVLYLSDPILQQKQIEKWKLLAGICVALVAGGFSAAWWLHANFTSHDDGAELKKSQAELLAAQTKLTLEVTKLTTVTAGTGKLLDETRKDMKDMQKDVRALLPPRARRASEARASARPEPAPFEDTLRQVKIQVD